MREARARLKEDGLLSLSFAVVSKEIGRKIYMMMTEAFDGRPPLCLRGAYDGSVIFLQKKNGGVAVPASLEPRPPPGLLGHGAIRGPRRARGRLHRRLALPLHGRARRTRARTSSWAWS